MHHRLRKKTNSSLRQERWEFLQATKATGSTGGRLLRDYGGSSGWKTG